MQTALTCNNRETTKTSEIQSKWTAGEEVEEEGEHLHFQEACLVLSNKQVGRMDSEQNWGFKSDMLEI